MLENELCSQLPCITSISDLNYYRKASSISISVSSLGLFGGWQGALVTASGGVCTPGCVTRGEKVCCEYGCTSPLVLDRSGTAAAASWMLGRAFLIKNKFLTCTFNLCRCLILINRFSVVVLCKTPALFPLPPPESSFLTCLSPTISLSLMCRSPPCSHFLSPAFVSSRGEW